jgi:hypothetical protein
MADVISHLLELLFLTESSLPKITFALKICISSNSTDLSLPRNAKSSAKGVCLSQTSLQSENEQRI